MAYPEREIVILGNSSKSLNIDVLQIR